MRNILVEKYLGENKIKKAKEELADLKKFEKMGKLTLAGQKRKEKIEDFLFSQGIFDI